MTVVQSVLVRCPPKDTFAQCVVDTPHHDHEHAEPLNVPLALEQWRTYVQTVSGLAEHVLEVHIIIII